MLFEKCSNKINIIKYLELNILLKFANQNMVIMKKTSVILFIFFMLLSCSVNRFGSKSPIYMSSFRTLYDENFVPYYTFSVTNNSSKTITTVEIYVEVQCYRSSYSGASWRPRWDTSIAPGQTKSFRCPSDFAPTSDLSLKKFELTRVRFSDGTIYGK